MKFLKTSQNFSANKMSQKNISQDNYTFNDNNNNSNYANSFNMKYTKGVEQSSNVEMNNRLVYFNSNNSQGSFGNNMNNKIGKNMSVNNENTIHMDNN